MARECSIEGCFDVVFARDWCSAHYTRWYRHGDPLAGGPSRGDIILWLKQEIPTRVRSDDCWEWPYYKDPSGYGRISYGGETGRLVSHLALECDGRKRPPFPEDKALHSCDNPSCFNPVHLRWGTQQNNTEDAVSRLRHHHGETHRNAKLTEENVRAILIDARSHAAIARDYNVQREAVSKIKQGKRWKHIERVAL
jgi:hypothetical protein